MKRLATIVSLLAAASLGSACRRTTTTTTTTSPDVTSDNTSPRNRDLNTTDRDLSTDRTDVTPPASTDNLPSSGTTTPSNDIERVRGSQSSLQDQNQMSRLLVVQDPSGMQVPVLDVNLIKQVQQKLSAMNLPTKTDGTVDAQFLSSLKQFQQQKNLSATGMLDKKTIDALGLDWNQFNTIKPAIPAPTGSSTDKGLQDQNIQRTNGSSSQDQLQNQDQIQNQDQLQNQDRLNQDQMKNQDQLKQNQLDQSNQAPPDEQK